MQHFGQTKHSFDIGLRIWLQWIQTFFLWDFWIHFFVLLMSFLKRIAETIINYAINQQKAI